MNYHSIYYASEKIGRGGFPQSQNTEMEAGRKVTDPDFIWNLRGDTKPHFKPYVGTLVLQDGSTITDFISSAVVSTGFVCSNKVEGLVKQANFGNTHFYNLQIKHKEIIYSNYGLMHCLNNYVDKIDYERSRFKKMRIENNKWVSEPHSIRDYAEISQTKIDFTKNKYGEWSRLEPSEIYLTEKSKIEHDIFNIWGVTFRTYISEKLRTQFEKGKITGLQFNFDTEPLKIF